MTVGSIQTTCRKVKVGELSKLDDDICLLSVSIGDNFHSLSLRLVGAHPIHPYILEKIKELIIALFAHSLEDVDRILNSKIIEITLCDELEKEKSNTDIDKEK